MKAVNFKNILKAILLSAVISAAAMGILAGVIFLAGMSDKTAASLVFALTAASVLIGAFVLAKGCESRGLLHGLIMAAGYYALLCLLSLAVNGGLCMSMNNLARLAAVLAAGMLGGTLGINT